MNPEPPDISRPTEEQADKCPHGVSCIESGRCGDKEMCKVERSSGENILWLEGKIPLSCPYMLPFGYGHLCTCPVHSRLHKEEMRKSSASAGTYGAKGKLIEQYSDISGVAPKK